MATSIRFFIGCLVTLLVCTTAHAQGPRISLGVDELQKSGFADLAGKRVGLVTNPSGVDSSGRSTIDILRAAKNVRLVALFGPEHGVYGKIKAGKYVPTQIDSATGLKVHSLYNKTRKPTPEMMRGLDYIVYDLQDIGCRSYTFISTLGLVMEAAAENGVRVMVLDRPNPLGGLRVEGPRLNPNFKSFVGMYDIPYVYGLTPGELARWINQKYLARPCELTVVPMKGWTRSMTWEETGLRWVPTSPNIPCAVATHGYVATGLLGEIGVANGANDRYPFEVIAAERLDSNAFCRAMSSLDFPGVEFEPYVYRPRNNPKKVLSGSRLRVDPNAKANLTSIPLYTYGFLAKTFPQKNYFGGLSKDEISMFDKINGTDQIRRQLAAGKQISLIVKSWEKGVAKWLEEREPYLIYSDKYYSSK